VTDLGNCHGWTHTSWIPILSAAPSRTRLSGWWFYLQEDGVNGQKTLSGRDLLPATRLCSRGSEHVTDAPSDVGFGCSGLSSLSLRPVLALRHWGRIVYQAVIGCVSTFLDPFAPPELPGFLATMGPLTPARSAFKCRPYPGRSLCFMCLAVRPFRLQPPNLPHDRFHTLPLSVMGFRVAPVRASPFPSRLAAQ
jgi:hypothetical protein